MEVRKWTTIDVHYKLSEKKIADKERKMLERIGYDFQQTDESGSGDYKLCDQYIKSGKTRTINN